MANQTAIMLSKPSISLLLLPFSAVVEYDFSATRGHRSAASSTDREASPVPARMFERSMNTPIQVNNPSEQFNDREDLIIFFASQKQTHQYITYLLPNQTTTNTPPWFLLLSLSPLTAPRLRLSPRLDPPALLACANKNPCPSNFHCPWPKWNAVSVQAVMILCQEFPVVKTVNDEWVESAAILAGSPSAKYQVTMKMSERKLEHTTAQSLALYIQNVPFPTASTFTFHTNNNFLERYKYKQHKHTHISTPSF